MTITAAVPNPSVSSAAHTFMAKRLTVLRAVYAGTEGLQTLGTAVLPMYAKEGSTAYGERMRAQRLRRNMFRQSVDRITGRIFQQNVRLIDPEVSTPAPPPPKPVPPAPVPGGPPVDLPQAPPPRPAPPPPGPGQEIAKDFDLRGNTMDRVARTLYHSALKLGLYCALVDYPVVQVDNLAQERRLAPRPFVILVDPSDVLRCYQNDDGDITHVAWLTHTVEWDERLAREVLVRRIHERYRGRSITWVEQGSNSGGVVMPGVSSGAVPGVIGANQPGTQNLAQGWKKEFERAIIVPGDDPDRIQFHVFYAEREAHMVGRTPLTEVADLTCEHFMIAAEYRNALRKNLFPVLTATGIEQKNIGDISFTPETVLGSTNPQAKFAMLEHSGVALEAGFKDLDSLEQRAEAYAGRLTKPSGDVKATTESINHAEVSSFAKDMALSLQATLQEMLDDMALWTGDKSLGTAKVNLDFAVDFGASDMADIQAMRASGDLTRETVWLEASRRDVLSSDFDPIVETSRLEEEQASSMAMEARSMKMATDLATAQGLATEKAKADNRPPPRVPTGA